MASNKHAQSMMQQFHLFQQFMSMQKGDFDNNNNNNNVDDNVNNNNKNNSNNNNRNNNNNNSKKNNNNNNNNNINTNTASSKSTRKRKAVETTPQSATVIRRTRASSKKKRVLMLDPLVDEDNDDNTNNNDNNKADAIDGDNGEASADNFVWNDVATKILLEEFVGEATAAGGKSAKQCEWNIIVANCKKRMDENPAYLKDFDKLTIKTCQNKYYNEKRKWQAFQWLKTKVSGASLNATAIDDVWDRFVDGSYGDMGQKFAKLFESREEYPYFELLFPALNGNVVTLDDVEQADDLFGNGNDNNKHNNNNSNAIYNSNNNTINNSNNNKNKSSNSNNSNNNNKDNSNNNNKDNSNNNNKDNSNNIKDSSNNNNNNNDNNNKDNSNNNNGNNNNIINNNGNNNNNINKNTANGRRVSSDSVTLSAPDLLKASENLSVAKRSEEEKKRILTRNIASIINKLVAKQILHQPIAVAAIQYFINHPYESSALTELDDELAVEYIKSVVNANNNNNNNNS